MPRQARSGGSSRTPSRPSLPTKSSTTTHQQQTRPATSAAHPPTQTAPVQQTPAGSGLLGQVASTAAGVAIGSSIGNAIGGLFGGGASQAVSEPPNNSVSTSSSQDQQNSYGARSCETDARQFTKCMDDNQGNMQVCNWYLEQLKACQQAASQY